MGDVKSNRIPVMCKRLLLSTERAEDAAADTARDRVDDANADVGGRCWFGRLWLMISQAEEAKSHGMRGKARWREERKKALPSKFFCNAFIRLKISDIFNHQTQIFLFFVILSSSFILRTDTYVRLNFVA